MGETVNIKCRQCGYTTGATYGGAKKDVANRGLEPALDTDTNEIESVVKYIWELKTARHFLFFKREIMAERAIEYNGKYIFFSDPKMFIADSDNSHHRKYLCPKCKTFNLEFNSRIFFD